MGIRSSSVRCGIVQTPQRKPHCCAILLHDKSAVMRQLIRATWTTLPAEMGMLSCDIPCFLALAVEYIPP